MFDASITILLHFKRGQYNSVREVTVKICNKETHSEEFRIGQCSAGDAPWGA